MAFTPLHPDPDVEKRLRRRQNIRSALLALVAVAVIVAGFQTWRSVRHQGESAHVATKLVTITSAEAEQDGVHITARLDAAAPDGTSHELHGIVPTATWNLTKTLWACYPPSDPNKGELRTPLDATCPTFVEKN